VGGGVGPVGDGVGQGGTVGSGTLAGLVGGGVGGPVGDGAGPVGDGDGVGQVGWGVGSVGWGVGHRTAAGPVDGGVVPVGCGVGLVGLGTTVGQVGMGIGVPVGRVRVGNGRTDVARAGAPRTPTASRPATSAVISALTTAMPAGRALRHAGRRRVSLSVVSRFLIAFPSTMAKPSWYAVLRGDIRRNAWSAAETALECG
jgi:hypothetical protein